ncbi:hypothetical protein [Sphingomonas sp. LT1P40]|uniref:hypothetical protein n=1 Tax=Alteristakelama amylovorans TaxID=3096166 RepID=UPI002FC9A470
MSLLTLIAPVFGASLLNATYGFVLRVNEIIGPAQSIVGGFALWTALLAIFWMAWRMRRSNLADSLDSERKRQIDTILADDAAYLDLPPTEQMQQIEQNISTCDGVAAQLAEMPDAESQGKLKQLLDMRDTMVTQYTFLDVDRRIDLTQVRVEEPATGGFWGALRLGLFSKGAQNTITSTSKLLKRGGTAVACFLVLGVTAPVLANQGIIPALGSINDIQVFRTQQDAQNSLKQVAKQVAARPPVVSAEEEAGASGSYHVAARQFARALVSSPDWRSSVTRVHPEMAVRPAGLQAADRLIEEIVIRDTILRDFAQNASGRASAMRGMSFASDTALPETARQQYGEFRDFVARRSVESNSGETAVNRIEKWIRAKADASPVFRARLEAGLASFRQPASLGDMFGGVLDEALSASIDGALPDPADRARIDRMGSEAKGAIKDAASRMLQSKLADFLNDIEAGTNYASSIDRVRKGARVPAFFMQSEADLARTLLRNGDANAQRVASTAADLHPTLQRSDPPQATARVARAVEDLRPMVSSSESLRSAIEGSVGSYEDLFPGRAQALNESPLGRALTKSYGSSVPVPPSIAQAAAGGGGGGGGGIGGGGDASKSTRSASAGSASRSFSRLRGSVRVGGVLIGTDPQGDGKINVDDITWTSKGPMFDIFLRQNGKAIPVGQFDGEMVQQALAYAADARPTTVTMTSGPLMPSILRVHIHPALVDSALGCEMMELDRFVDAATGEWPERSLWSMIVATQLAVYNAATGDDDALGMFADDRGPPFALAVNTAFADRWRERDAVSSIFAHDPQRFDMSLVARIKECRPQVAEGQQAFLNCVKAAPVNTARYQSQPYAIWSGVREKDYPMTVASIARSAAGSSSDHFVRFMLQIAFEREQPCDDEACAGVEPVGPWEFPVIADGIGDRTLAFARGNPLASRILGRADQFTQLQRLFRTGLSGRLGDAFPRHRLIALMADAAKADPIDGVTTPDWNQPRNLAQQLLGRLRQDAGSNPMASQSRARLTYLESVLHPDSGERFAGSETCRGGTLALR